MNQTQYAAHRGVSKMAVSKAVKAGRIKQVNGRIDSEAADIAWARNTRVNVNEHQNLAAPPAGRDRPSGMGEATTGHGPRAAPQEQKGPVPGSLAHAQLLKETAKAKREVWASQLEEGKLIEVAKVESTWAEVGSRVKDEVMALPTRIVNRLPEEWRRQVNAIATEEARRALSAISHEFLPNRATA